MRDDGRIELERAVDSIRVGTCQRIDLGDLEPLKRSITDLGLLQPITIAPDGTLLCGRRRLAAITELGWSTVKVWVRSGISDRLNRLLAWQDENMLHKPLSVIEAAELYRELRALMGEDAARRQQATRFGSTDERGTAGGADSAPPGPSGKSRRQAAETVTGSASYSRLEQVNALSDLASDPSQDEHVRKLAERSIEQIREGAPVASSFAAVRDVERASASALPDDELDRLAREALERIKQPRTRRTASRPAAPPRKRSTRAFVHIWTDLDGWSARYDAAEVGPALGDGEWDQFERVAKEIAEFYETARESRGEAQTRAIHVATEDDAHLRLV